MDSIQKEFGEEPAEPASIADEDGKEGTNKRPNPGAGRGVQKKLKVAVDESKLIPIENLGDAGKLVDIPLLNVKQPSVHLRLMTGQGVYLINTGGQEVTLKAGIILAGYGKGSFNSSEKSGTAEIDPTKEVLFDMKTGADWVPRLQKIIYIYIYICF